MQGYVPANYIAQRMFLRGFKPESSRLAPCSGDSRCFFGSVLKADVCPSRVVSDSDRVALIATANEGGSLCTLRNREEKRKRDVRLMRRGLFTWNRCLFSCVPSPHTHMSVCVPVLREYCVCSPSHVVWLVNTF